MTPHLGPAITVVLILALITAGYVSTYVIWPFTACRHCGGTGKRRSLLGGKTFRLCRRCHHTGMRLRTGRKVWNFFHRLHGEAHR